MVSFFRHHVSIATLLQLVLEGGLFFLAVVIAVVAQQQGAVAEPGVAIMPALLFAGLMVSVNSAFGLYTRSQALVWSSLVARALLALLVGAPIAYVVYFVLPNGYVFQNALGYTVLLALAAVVAARLVMSASAQARFFTHRVLVLGTGAHARDIDDAARGAASTGLRIVGFLPVAASDDTEVPFNRILPAGTSLRDAVERLGVDEVVVALREQRGGSLPLGPLLNCRLSGVRVTNVAGFIERVNGEVPVESVKASWLIYGEGFQHGGIRAVVKRMFDVVVAAALLLLTLPVMLVTALLISMEGKGPIVFRQERVGLGGRSFTLLKFRSMRADAEQDGRARWAVANDARVTRIGRIMRRTRIDELPQLVNVLKGEMSFVGPRPERPSIVSTLSEQLPFYGARHSVKPGITGWAQVRFPYGASVEDAMKKLRYDLYYVKNHSLFLDFVILVETVRVVLLGQGAR